MQKRQDMALWIAVLEFKECRDIADRVHFVIDHGNDRHVRVDTLQGLESPLIQDGHEYIGSVGMNCGFVDFCDAVIRLLKANSSELA